MSLRVRLSSYWCAFQEYLFPTIEAVGPLGERYQLFIAVLELVRVEQHALFSYPARSPATGSYGVGARLHRQGGVPDRHYQGTA